MKLSPRVYLFNAGAKPPLLPPNGIALPQIPSRAFGDGSHPTTRLCAGAVDVICGMRAGLRVLDVGTGTGVLARIARARGASEICATDIDWEALTAARANAKLDSEAFEIQFSDESPPERSAHFDLVVANILEAPLQALKSALVSALAPQGILLLSGFTPLQVPSLRTHYEGAELRFMRESVLEGWVLLMFEKSGDSSTRVFARG